MSTKNSLGSENGSAGNRLVLLVLISAAIALLLLKVWMFTA